MNWVSAAKFFGWRLVQVIPVVLLATAVVFTLIQLAPGDLALTLAGENVTPERLETIRRLYGLDRPLPVQYLEWLGRAAQGDLGSSILSGEQVWTSISRRLPNTLILVVLAILLSLVIGVPLGIAAAQGANTRVDSSIGVVTSFGIAIPSFWFGMILVSYFALHLRWFPATGMVSLTTDPWAALRYAALPSIALAGSGIAEVTRQVRTSLIEFLNSQAARTLRAKGLPPASILWRHGMKNISVTFLTVTGLLFNRLLGATVVIEAVFAIPGIGSLITGAAINKDYPIIQGAILILVLIVILTNITVDFLYSVFDPRIGRGDA